MAEGEYTVTYPTGTVTYDQYNNIVSSQLTPARPMQQINDNYSIYALRPEDIAKFEQDYQFGRSMGQDKPWALSAEQVPVRRTGEGQWEYNIAPTTQGGSTFNDATGQYDYFPTEQGGLFGLGPLWGSVVGAGLVLGAGFGLGAGASALGVAPGVIGIGGMGGAGGGAVAGGAGAGALLGSAGADTLGTAAALGTNPAMWAGSGLVGGAAGAAGAGGGAAALAAPAVAGGLAGTLGAVAPYAPLIATGVGALGSVVGGAMQAGAARDAANTQAAAAAAANQTLQSQYAQNRTDLAPYREAGVQALGGLTDLMKQPMTYPAYQAQTPLDPGQYAFNAEPYAFRPPSGQEVLNQDPGYQFRVQQGQLALDRQASGKGQLLSGGQLKGAARFSQDLASQEYGAAYGRSLAQNQMGYERALQGNEMTYGRAQTANEQAQQRNLQQYNTNYNTMTGLQGIRYNQLAGLAGTGQTATSQLGQLGAATAANVANNQTSAGAAQAGGQVGAANAVAGGIQGVGNAANNYLNYSLLQQMMTQSPLQNQLVGTNRSVTR